MLRCSGSEFLNSESSQSIQSRNVFCASGVGARFRYSYRGIGSASLQRVKHSISRSVRTLPILERKAINRKERKGRKEKRAEGLFLSHSELMLAHRGGINAVRERELRIHPDLWIPRCQKLIYKKFQHKVRHFDSVQ